MAGNTKWNCKKRKKYIQSSIRKIERKRSLGKLTLRREDNIKMHFKELGLEVVDCFHVAHVRGRCWCILLKVNNRLLPWKAGNCFVFQ